MPINDQQLDEIAQSIIRSQNEDSVRNLETLSSRKERSAQILIFMRSHESADIKVLPLTQKEKYSLLFYDLSLTAREIGDNDKTVEYADCALDLAREEKEIDPVLMAMLFYTKAVSQRELALKEEPKSDQERSYLDTALTTFSSMREVLLSHPKIFTEEKKLFSLKRIAITLGICAYQDAAIACLRYQPLSEKNLQQAIEYLQQSLNSPLMPKDPGQTPDMIFVRVYSYLALANILHAECCISRSPFVYAQAARLALQNAEDIAKKNGEFEKTNSDVATVEYHFSRLCNFLGEPIEAFCHAARALEIRTNILMRLQSKIYEVYAQLDESFEKIEEMDNVSEADKQQLTKALPRLCNIVEIQNTAPDKEAAKGNLKINYYKDLADKTSKYTTALEKICLSADQETAIVSKTPGL